MTFTAKWREAKVVPSLWGGQSSEGWEEIVLWIFKGSVSQSKHNQHLGRIILFCGGHPVAGGQRAWHYPLLRTSVLGWSSRMPNLGEDTCAPKMGQIQGVLAALTIMGEIENPTNDWHWIYHQTEMRVQFLWAKTYTYWVYTPERSSVDICQIPWASGGTPTSHANDSTPVRPPITAPWFLRPVTSAPGCSTCLCLWPKQLLSFQGHGPGSPIMNPGVSSNLDTGPYEDKSWLQTWHNRTVFTVM